MAKKPCLKVLKYADLLVNLLTPNLLYLISLNLFCMQKSKQNVEGSHFHSLINMPCHPPTHLTFKSVRYKKSK